MGRAHRWVDPNPDVGERANDDEAWSGS